jgi:hypothetical protein
MTGTQWLLVAVILLGLGLLVAGVDVGRRRLSSGGSGAWFGMALLGLVAVIIAVVLLITGS